MTVVSMSEREFSRLDVLSQATLWMQWFIKQGRHHPLDAVGYVAAVIVFVTTSVLHFWRNQI
jgi:hypothetical protein